MSRAIDKSEMPAEGAWKKDKKHTQEKKIYRGDPWGKSSSQLIFEYDPRYSAWTMQVKLYALLTDHHHLYTFLQKPKAKSKSPLWQKVNLQNYLLTDSHTSANNFLLCEQQKKGKDDQEETTFYPHTLTLPSYVNPRQLKARLQQQKREASLPHLLRSHYRLLWQGWVTRTAAKSNLKNYMVVTDDNRLFFLADCPDPQSRKLPECLAALDLHIYHHITPSKKEPDYRSLEEKIIRKASPCSYKTPKPLITAFIPSTIPPSGITYSIRKSISNHLLA